MYSMVCLVNPFIVITFYRIDNNTHNTHNNRQYFTNAICTVITHLIFSLNVSAVAFCFSFSMRRRNQNDIAAPAPTQ